jgi:hypothetical protein
MPCEREHARRRTGSLRARARRLSLTGAALAAVLLVPVALLPAADAPFTATVSNGTSTVRAHAWKSYVFTLQNDGSPAYWWRLGEASGNNTATAQAGGQNGTYLNGHGAQNPGAITGDANTAVTFNGSNQCLQFGDFFDTVSRTRFSAELWIRRTSAPSGVAQRLVGKLSGSGGWEVAINPPDVGSNRSEIYFARTDDGGTATYTGSNAAISLNTWYHIVVTYDGTTMSFYLNGAQTGTATSTGNLANNGEPVVVGCLGNLSSYFTGAIDEVALYYDNVLSPRQVLSHYYAGLAGN